MEPNEPPGSQKCGGEAISAENLPHRRTLSILLLLSLLFLLSGLNPAFAENETETPRKISEPTTTFATFDYDGATNDPGYYPDGTLRFAQETLFSQSRQWRWDYHYDGSLASEQMNSQSPVEFSYDSGGNLTRWGSESGWQYSGNFLTGISSWNWSFDYTANGERSVWYAGPVQGGHLEGDVDQDGCVNDEDYLAVAFALGQGPNYTGPEDLNGDGYVNETDLLIVLFNYGSYIWTYEYDVWGNLTRASSPCVGTYEAGYDSLGRRVWQEIDDVRTYFLYDGDTLIGEVAQVDNDWQLIAEYVWGPLGPLMMRRYNPQTQSWYNYYYVQDGLRHTRLLLDGNGNVINRSAYDAWGNLIEYVENVPNPFTWNGAYGYEYIPLTGLYHIGAREYDPRTARWLQRDPIEALSGDPNFWRYCGNDPVNGADPSGLFAFDVSQSIHDTLVWFGTVSIWAGMVRDLYKKDVRTLAPEDNIGRLNKQLEWQKKTPKPYQNFLPARNEATAAAGTDATKTNPYWDRLGRFAKSVGKTCIVASAAYDVYEVMTDDDPWRKGFENVFGWLGAIAGGTLGAAAGTGVGSVALGVGGAVVGGAAGRGFGGWLYDTFF